MRIHADLRGQDGDGMALLTFAAFAAITAEQPWSDGVQDCCMWPADWCVARWGVDPARSFRERYSTEAEAEALIAAAGSLVELVRPHMAFLTQKEAPDDGDVGVIEVLGRQTGAVRAGDKWAFRTRAGIGFLDVPALIGWGN